jgi:DNA topoisomerase VI subunit B
MAKQAARLKRETLRTSRLLDFCSEKELVAQTGHERAAWPLVALKELADNALDACENQGIPPVLKVAVDHTGITVADNGPGIAADVVADVLDFTVRVSDKEHYVSPTRGAQGNALKTLVTMPYVLHGEHGRVTIAARGIRHEIDLRVDHIRQKPIVDRQQYTDKKVKKGTLVHVHWPSVCMDTLTSTKERFLQIAEDYTLLNPHLALSVEWFGEQICTKATTLRWKKWLPADPPSAHWYDRQRFERLVAGYIAHDADHAKDRLVREFLWKFSGMSSTAKHKAVLQATGLARVNLAALQNGTELDHKRAGKLLDALKAHSKPVKAKALGTIGRDHLAARFEAHGCRMESFAYRNVSTDEDSEGLPCVLETAFAWRPGSQERRVVTGVKRRVVTGVNWSPGIRNLFRQIGQFGESLDAVLQEQKVGWDAEAVFLLHVACPRVDYTDRGKSAVVVGADPAHVTQEDS